LLFNECYADTSCEALYKEALEDLQTLVGSLELPSKGERFAELLAPCQALELESRREYSAAEIAAGVEEALEFADSRSIPLDEYLEEDSPPDLPETSDPPTEEPCSPQAKLPVEEVPPPTPVVVVAPDGPKLWVGPPKLRGKQIVTRMILPGPGRADQRVTAKLGKRRPLVCSVRKSREAAGPLKLQCPLPEWAQQRRESKPLSLSVRVSFTPSAGDPTRRTSGLSAPRLLNR
jgi:hypothetical protein